jgi:hypothetical protein
MSIQYLHNGKAVCSHCMQFPLRGHFTDFGIIWRGRFLLLSDEFYFLHIEAVHIHLVYIKFNPYDYFGFHYQFSFQLLHTPLSSTEASAISQSVGRRTKSLFASNSYRMNLQVEVKEVPKPSASNLAQNKFLQFIAFMLVESRYSV